jgi:hypothetical protein
MKKCCLYLICFLSSFIANAQLTAYRYWYDNDFSNAVTVNGSFGNNYNLQQSLSVNQLNNGLHTLNIAFKDNSNKWSSTSSSFFFKQPSSVSGQAQYQYWFDNNFNAAVTPNNTSSNNYSLIANLDVNALSNGLHSLNIRFRPDGNSWSSVVSSFFYKAQSTGIGAAKYQYWLDNNVQDSVTVNITSTNNLNLITNLNVNNINSGLHTLNIRFKPDGGAWSVVKSDFFYKISGLTTANRIVKFRYWFDNDWQNSKTLVISTNSTNDFFGKLDVEGLSDGIHTVKYYFKDKAGLWSSVITDTITKVNITNTNALLPKIYINKAAISNSGTNTISGKDFTLNGLAQLVVSQIASRKKVLDTMIYAETNGSFNYNFSANAAMEKGTYKVTAQDIQKGILAPEKYFSIQNNDPVTTNDILVKAPVKASTYCVGQTISVDWIDKMKRNFNLSAYQLCDKTKAERLCKYKIQIIDTVTNNIAKELSLEFCANLYETISQNTFFSLSTIGVYRAKVIDMYSNSFHIGDWFKVVAAPQNSVTELVWDKSFPSNSNGGNSPVGVCADGTSRVLLKISKKAGSLLTLQSAFISLHSDDGGGLQELGKLKISTVKNDYSLEANNANQLEVNTSALAEDGSFWIWYVAPANFVNSLNDKFADQRTVNASVVTTFSNGATETCVIPIAVVRPPLYLAHGLGGDESTWDKFEYHDKYEDVYSFKGSKLFKVVKAAHLCGNCLYRENADILVNRLNIAFANNLQTTIRDMRIRGFACNKVDYVCHSMGGDMIRYAITEQPYKDMYYGTQPNSNYKNYNRGFLNKLITLNTPHLGSPQANLINDFTNFINNSFWLRSLGYTGDVVNFFEEEIKGTNSIENAVNVFIRKDNSTIPPLYYPSDAVLNLKIPQVNGLDGGVALKETSVKNHAIYGDIDRFNLNIPCAVVNKLENMALPKVVLIAKKIVKVYEKSLELQNFIITAFNLPANKKPIPFALKLLDDNNYSIVCTLISWYYSKFGYADFLFESDLIVPVLSQTAGQSINATNVSPFYGFDSWHSAIHDNIEVGDRVLELLNSDINGPLFANIVPAVIPTYSGNIFRSQNPLLRSPQSEKPTLYIYDTTKIKIKSPANNSILNYDSTLFVNFTLKDTTNYYYSELLMRDENYTSTSLAPNQTIQIQTNRLFNGTQLFYLTAQFEYTDSIKIFYDSSYFQVQVNDTLKELIITPDSKNINIGQQYQPNIKLRYDSTLINLNNKDSLLSVHIGDTSIIRYEPMSKQFIGKANGKTWCSISYLGFFDTIYYYVGDVDQQVSFCSNSVIKFPSSAVANSSNYLWQVDSTGTGFVNLFDNAIFSGTSTDTLVLSSPPSSWYGHKYRCKITSSGGSAFSQEYFLKFTISWNGSVDNAWENPANWNCNSIPDGNVDVIINSGVPRYPQVNGNASCRSLTTKPGASVIVSPNANIIITQ